MPLEFVKFNVLAGVGDFYGTHPWHWYISQGYGGESGGEEREVNRRRKENEEKEEGSVIFKINHYKQISDDRIHDAACGVGGDVHERTPAARAGLRHGVAHCRIQFIGSQRIQVCHPLPLSFFFPTTSSLIHL